MQSTAATVEEYLEGLREERRQTVSKVRELILNNLPAGYEEGMQFGNIGYCIPLSRFPNTYNRQPLGYVGLASQKNYLSLYLMSVYVNQDTEAWFRESYKMGGKKLDMGKCCIRFKTMKDLPLDLIGAAIARTSVDEFIRQYEASRPK